MALTDSVILVTPDPDSQQHLTPHTPSVKLFKKLYVLAGWCTVLLRIWSAGMNVQISNLKIKKILWRAH